MAGDNDKDRYRDLELVRRAKRGDEDAYTALLNLYNSAILNYCYRLISDPELAQDLAQETFIKAFFSLDSFDESKKFSPWLYRIAHNLCVDYLRKKRLPTEAMYYEDSSGDEVSVDIADVSITPEALLERKEINEYFQSALSEVPPIYRDPLILRHQEDLSYQEISDILDIPVGTVKARIHRGRGMLKEKLRGFV